MAKKIVIGDRDLMHLRQLLRTTRAHAEKDREHRVDLQRELERASIVKQVALPQDVVALDSKVLVRDVQSGVCNVYAIVSPSRAHPARGLISVFAPLGTALLGFRTGDEVEWPMPGGVRRLKIEAVAQVEQGPEGPIEGNHRLAA
jgi:regulator of nucleoside diphosphate kinase